MRVRRTAACTLTLMRERLVFSKRHLMEVGFICVQ